MRTQTAKITFIASLAAALCLTLSSCNRAVSAATPLCDSAYDRMGGVYHSYIYEPGDNTPPPFGYKPFYISHIGRHGSRYPVDRGYVLNGLEPLSRCAEAGLLTDEGKTLLRGFEKLDSVSNGVYGFLCEEGAREHSAIARRMYRSYRRVFHQKGRDSIAVQSTHRQRCLMSSWNFCTSLAALSPSSHMGLVAGNKYYDLLSNAETKEISAHLKPFNKCSDAYAAAHFDFDAFYSRIFTDIEAARAFIPNDRLMAETSYANGAVAKYLGINEIYDSLTEEEFECASRNYAGKMNCQHCNSAENGEFRVQFARPLLGDFIAKADAALQEGSRIAADLRFTHDTGMMPFFGLIGLDGYDRLYTYEEAAQNWDATRLMCMGTNLQAIFCRNRAGKVVVKLLLNERETSIPALGKGPWYEWTQLREFLSKR